jgi:EmrB/QacA subfamily drug resistance transporter
MTTTTLPPDELISDRRLNILSVVLLIGAVTSILDTTIVNVALDHLHDVFHASVADTQWVASGYLLALAGVIPLTGWAVERFGARKVWITAVALFMIGSTLCGFAWDLPSLIGFRVLQGIGGGMLLPVTITILTQAAGPERLGRAMAAIMLPAQLAPILGPVIGGTIVDKINWNWLFFVNVPICLLALVLAPRYLPADRPNPGHRLDLRGFAMLTPGLVSLAYGISEAGGAGGFGSARAWLPITAGVVLIACFTVYALRTKRLPLIDVQMFRRRNFALASTITFVSGFSMFAGMFLVPMYYQVVRGDSALTTGLLLIPQGLGTMAFLLISGRVSKLVSTRLIVAGGIVLTMIGVLPFALAGSSGNDVLLLAGQFLRGVGVGASMQPIMALAFSGLARAEVPNASAAFSVVQRVGAPFGVTVIAVLLQSYLADAGSGIGQVVGAFNTTFWWIFAFSAVPLALAFFLPSLPSTAPKRVAPEPALLVE